MMIATWMFLLGSCIGSFLNVVLFRTQRKESISHGRSKCTNCKSAIRVFDLIPVLSFLILRGKCRACKDSIHLQYPLVEFVTGCLFVLAYFHSGSSIPLLVRDLGAICFLVLIFVYDLRYMMIPDRFTIPGIVFIFLMNLSLHIVTVSSMIMGAFVLGGFFLLQFLISRGSWVGGGDIRMGVLMGCLLGLKQGLVAMFLSYVLGAIFGIIFILLKKLDRKTHIPFGTFLSFGTICVVFVGPWLVNWYLGLFSF